MSSSSVFSARSRLQRKQNELRNKNLGGERKPPPPAQKPPPPPPPARNPTPNQRVMTRKQRVEMMLNDRAATIDAEAAAEQSRVNSMTADQRREHRRAERLAKLREGK